MLSPLWYAQTWCLGLRRGFPIAEVGSSGTLPVQPLAYPLAQRATVPVGRTYDLVEEQPPLLTTQLAWVQRPLSWGVFLLTHSETTASLSAEASGSDIFMLLVLMPLMHCCWLPPMCMAPLHKQCNRRALAMHLLCSLRRMAYEYSQAGWLVAVLAFELVNGLGRRAGPGRFGLKLLQSQSCLYIAFCSD